LIKGGIKTGIKQGGKHLAKDIEVILVYRVIIARQTQVNSVQL